MKGELRLSSPNYVTVEEARRMLKVSKMKMTALIRDGVLKAEENVFDKRQKLIKLTDVEALMSMPGFRQMANEEDATEVLGAGQFGLS